MQLVIPETVCGDIRNFISELCSLYQESRLAGHERPTFGIYRVTSSRLDGNVHPQPRLNAGA
jgi:hypothetical protein